MSIKAIQTRYKGYNFRSRLEARWAVFFDALGIPWEYETEGFDLGVDGYYLPDFRLIGKDTNGDKVNFWFDVKPEGVEISEQDMRTMQSFAEKMDFGYAGGFVILDGLPDINKGYKLLGDGRGNEVILWSHRRRPWFIIAENAIGEIEELYNCYRSYYYHMSEDGNWYEDATNACDAARSARFEHAQCGET